MELDQENKRYFELAEKWMDGTITSEEEQEYAHWYNSNQHLPIELPEGFATSSYAHQKRMLKRLNEKTGYGTNKRNLIKRTTAIAASIVLFSCLCIFYFQYKTHDHDSVALHVVNDIQPGSNRATLTLTNGEKINLTDVANGTLTQQSGTTVSKATEGQLVYQSISGKDVAEDVVPVKNTVETPNGGEYQIKLPDGTKVWLNAASALTFPTTFSGLTNRTVELSGEAYFEVAKNKEKPFVVKTNGQEVRVLGTKFNVSTYKNESTVKTTLIEGAVQVVTNAKVTILKPGEQAILQREHLNVKPVNLEEVTSWKNGYFWFNDEGIESIMRKLSRWYDIDVKYEGKVPLEEFNGKISRYKNISHLLKALESTGAIHFKIEGRRITVI